jgi:hypothetical protein
MPLAERQETAAAMGYKDGMALTEAEVRMDIERARDGGEDRQEWLEALRGPAGITERRIGSVNWEDVGALFAELWPVRT